MRNENNRRCEAGAILLATITLIVSASFSGCAQQAVPGKPSEPVASQEPAGDLTTHINIAGRQRMLTQRIVKSYIQYFLGVDGASARQQIEDSLALFESQLSLLQAERFGRQVNDALMTVGKLWPEFRSAPLLEPNRQTMQNVIVLSDRLLAASEEVVAALVGASTVALGELVDVSGRQRMLSQRYAKLYMLLAADLGGRSVSDELDQTRVEFEAALKQLRESPQNTSVSNELLDEMSSQWVWLEGSMRIESDKYYPWIVASVSEKLLVTAEALTERYAQN